MESQPLISTPRSASIAPTFGKNKVAIVSWTSRPLGSIAYAWSLALRIDDDLTRHFKVCPFIDVNVAVAVEVFEDGHGRLARYSADKRFAPSGYRQIDVLPLCEKVTHGCTVGRRHKLNAIGAYAALHKFVGEEAVQYRVGMECFLAAAEDDSVTALDAQARRINGYIWSRFIDEEDYAQRHTNLDDLEAIGSG